MPDMPLTIVTFQPMRIATLRYEGPYSVAISDFMRSFNEARTERGWTGDTFGIALNGETYSVTLAERATADPQLCRFDAGVVVLSHVAIAPPFVEQHLSGGRYALFEFSGAASAIGAAWYSAKRMQNADASLKPDARPDLEWHRKSDQVRDDGTFTCALCIAVK
jgi:AraC family transcriptional regulator